MEELNLKQLINIIWNGKKYIIITIILSVFARYRVFVFFSDSKI